VLVVRVHPEILAGQRLPGPLVTRHLWKERYQDINAFERYLARNGMVVLKFFLHVSKEEQRRRLLERLDQPAKNWKFQESDLGERDRWDDYMRAYEQALSQTSTAHAPWFVVPADHKWFTRLVVAGAVIDALEELDLAYPKVDSHKRAELKLVQAELETEGAGKKGKKAKAGKKVKKAKDEGRRTKDGRARQASAEATTDGDGSEALPQEHRAVGTEGRGATTGTV